jgi:NNP family nitrate/nitrite transporter-like MFS transporter
MLFLFFITGMGNAATFRQYPIIFAHNARQAAGVIGFTAAIAAFGPFIFSTAVSAVMKSTGNANGFFYGIAGFFVIATVVNWWYYNRKGCERPS